MTKKLDEYTKEELIDSLKSLKKRLHFGLVWEDKPEQVVKDCENNLPVLDEVVERAVYSTSEEGTHLIVEGDNYHSLSALNYTHAGKIDLIYIDPPYNTGNRDFVYNDHYIDRDDTFRHSKWLSFIDKRLRLAKDLLSEEGVLFISIDDNEQAHLTLLCDQIFGEANKIGTLPTVMNLKGNNDQFGFAGAHEYTLVYCKNKSFASINHLDIDEEEALAEWSEDDKGYYKKGATLKRTGNDAPREKRPYGYYPILVKKNDLSVTAIPEDEFLQIYDKKTSSFNDNYVEDLKAKYADNYHFLLPTNGSVKTSWRWNLKKLARDSDEIIVSSGSSVSLYKKQRPELGDLPSKKPKSILYKPEYSSGNGTAALKAIFGEKVFDNPKPVALIKDLVRFGSKKESIILDFMAGSGTTGQAVLELNKEDGGTRKVILCTNNENHIAENITYERMKAIVRGYGTVASIPANIRYFKTEFVSKQKTDDQTRLALVERCTDMIRVREDAYTPLIENQRLKVFSSRDHNTAIIFDPHSIEESISEIERLGDKKPINLYIFSYSNYAYEEDIPETKLEFTIRPIPESILEVYRRIFKEYTNV